MKCDSCGKEFDNIHVHWGSSPTCEMPESEYYKCSYEQCDDDFRTKRELVTHEKHHPKHRESGRICYDCGHRFDRISQHWTASSECSYPDMTKRHHDIIRGLLMGDGTIQKGSTNPCIKVCCIVPEYLQLLSDEFGVLGGPITVDRTPEESAANNRETGFRPDAKAENYSTLYRWQTKSHPDMLRYTDWYKTGEKVWPTDLELAPETLTHWFCGDGNNSKDYPAIRIAMSNERENKKKVERYFERQGLPAPERWSDGKYHCNACWGKEASIELFEYMTAPVVGYEYKWPEY